MLKDSCQAKFNPSQFVPGLKIVDWRAISKNETEIAEKLMEIGPLSVALNAQLLQFYHKGIFNPIKCDPKALNHGKSTRNFSLFLQLSHNYLFSCVACRMG